MYEFGSFLPRLGESMKKKFGEKLSHSISLKLVTVALKFDHPAENNNSSPIFKLFISKSYYSRSIYSFSN